MYRGVDGDTLLVEVDLGFYVKKVERVRLARIDAPEMDSEVAYQVRQAKSARSKAKKFCPKGQIVTLQTSKEKRDRYARYIGEVICKGQNLSDYLINLGVVKKWGKD